MKNKEDFFITEEVAQWIGQKKSEYLSKLIISHTSDDFKIEEYHLYDPSIPKTLEKPDSVYERIEEEQKVRTYLKTYDGRPAFYQVVIGVVLDDAQKNSDVFVPVLSFVSRKKELVKEFLTGTLHPVTLLN